jgi:hypothetical protein
MAVICASLPAVAMSVHAISDLLSINRRRVLQPLFELFVPVFLMWSSLMLIKKALPDSLPSLVITIVSATFVYLISIFFCSPLARSTMCTLFGKMRIKQ